MKVVRKYAMTQLASSNWIIALLSLFVGCSPAQEVNTNGLKSVKIRFNLPMVINNKLANQSDSFTIFYYRDVIVIRNELKNSSSKLHFDSTGEFLGQDSIRDDKSTFSYFIYRRDSTIGLRYRALKPGSGKQYSVDSFLKQYNFDNMGLYKDIYKDAVVTRPSLNQYDEVEQIVPTVKPDQTYPDTVYLYFQKKTLFDGIDYALSSSLDSTKGKKLVRSRFIFNPKLPTKSTPLIPAMELSFDLQSVDGMQDKELVTFLRQHIK